MPAAVVEQHGVGPLGPVRREVGEPHEPAAPLHLGVDQLGRRALVEAVGALVRDALEHDGEVGVLPAGTGREGLAAGEEEGLRGGVVLQALLVVGRALGEGGVDGEALLRQLDRGGEELGPRELLRPELLVRLRQPGDAARHAGGEVPEPRVSARLRGLVLERVVRRGERRGFAEVQRVRLAVHARDHEPAPAHVPRARVHHRQRERRRHRRVHRVAPRLEHVEPDLRPQGRVGHDHAVLPADGRGVVGPARRERDGRRGRGDGGRRGRGLRGRGGRAAEGEGGEEGGAGGVSGAHEGREGSLWGDEDASPAARCRGDRPVPVPVLVSCGDSGTGAGTGTGTGPPLCAEH